MCTLHKQSLLQTVKKLTETIETEPPKPGYLLETSMVEWNVTIKKATHIVLVSILNQFVFETLRSQVHLRLLSPQSSFAPWRSSNSEIPRDHVP